MEPTFLKEDPSSSASTRRYDGLNPTLLNRHDETAFCLTTAKQRSPAGNVYDSRHEP